MACQLFLIVGFVRIFQFFHFLDCLFNGDLLFIDSIHLSFGFSLDFI